MPDQPQTDPNLPQSYYFEEDTISLSDILLVFARQLKIILITPILIYIITVIYIQYFAVPIYMSTAKIMSSSGNNASQASGLAAQFGIVIPSAQAEPQWVYPEIIKSRTLARALLNRRFDTEKFGIQKPLLQILTYGENEPNVGIDTLIKAGVSAVAGMIKIEPNGSFYDLEISSTEPIFSRDFAVALIEELDSHLREYNERKVGETVQFIEDRISDTEKKLNSAEEALKNFRDRNRRIENSPALNLEQERLSREVSVLIGVFTTLKSQLETANIEKVKDSDYVIVLDPPEAPLGPSKPNKKSIFTLAVIVGLGLGIIFAYIKEYIENSDEEEQEKMGQIKSLIINNITDFIPEKILKR